MADVGSSGNGCFFGEDLGASGDFGGGLLYDFFEFGALGLVVGDEFLVGF